MVTMPLAFLFGALIGLGVRWGGWAVFPVLVSVAFGLVAASTDPGAVATEAINGMMISFFAWLQRQS